MIKKKLPAQQKDPRITAPLISWKAILIFFGILAILSTVSAFIYIAFFDDLGTLIALYVYYVAVTCVLFAALIGVIWRYVMCKPIKKVASAARKVTTGDYSVQIETDNKDGKKNEIDVLIEDFNKMARQLAGNEMLKNDFIANVSHEIKTPLSVILSYTTALKDGCVAEEERDNYMEVIIDTAEKLNVMITNILKLSKLENQQIFPVPEKYQLGEQLRCCALGYMEQWQAKEIEFEIDVLDVEINYDASLLELVWNNLLSNAIKFTNNGGHISFTSRKTENSVIVTVKDDGCGMDEETLARVYEKFYQGDTSHTAEGNGLGLALVKRIVDIIGGNITIESAPEKGTAFTVKLNI